MSILVYDGVSLASDSHANNGGMAFPFPKIWAQLDSLGNPVRLAGVIGPLNAASALRQWFDTGLDPAKYPDIAVLHTGAQLVTVTKEKGLLRYHKSAIPHLHGHNKLAIGEGASVAYGVLEALEKTGYKGNDVAKLAVEAAIKYSVFCNGVAEVLTL